MSRFSGRLIAAIALAGALALGTLAPSAAVAAHASSTPWPGHPDRRLVAHVVHRGETATGLAVRYHAWTRELIRLNHLGPKGNLRVGQRIRIPVVISATTKHTLHEKDRKPQEHLTKKQKRMYAAGWRHWQLNRSQIRRIITKTALRHRVPTKLALAIAWQESGWHQPLVSNAGAIGVMQILPGTGRWMQIYAGRPLNLRGTRDNVLAGVLLLRVLKANTSTVRRAIAAYYQGLGAVRRHGLYPDTKRYVTNVQALRRRM